jgi:hypothetical protein
MSGYQAGMGLTLSSERLVAENGPAVKFLRKRNGRKDDREKGRCWRPDGWKHSCAQAPFAYGARVLRCTWTTADFP